MKRHPRPRPGDVYAEGGVEDNVGGIYLVLHRDPDHEDAWTCLVLHTSVYWREEPQVVYNTENWLMNACSRLR